MEKLIYICSPYKGNVVKNTKFAIECCKYAMPHGIPFAPHLYFTQFLDDRNPEEREKGLEYGLQILEMCDEVWVFGEHISEGMGREIRTAEKLGKAVKYCGI